MSENESAKAYLERRKAVVGRLQGQHQVPGSTSKTLAQVKDICIHLFKYKPWPGTKKLSSFHNQWIYQVSTTGRGSQLPTVAAKRAQQWEVQEREAGGGEDDWKVKKIEYVHDPVNEKVLSWSETAARAGVITMVRGTAEDETGAAQTLHYGLSNGNRELQKI